MDYCTISPPAYSPYCPNAALFKSSGSPDVLPDVGIIPKQEIMDMDYCCSKTADYEELEFKPSLASIENKLLKQKRDEAAPESCDICGEPTNTYHYDVASCNGCRTFFRRTIILSKTYFCFNGGKCPRQLYRNCRACRFDRCIVAGMNLDAIKFPKDVNVPHISQAIGHRRKEILHGMSSNPFKFHAICPDTLECQEVDALVYTEGRCSSLREFIDPVAQYVDGLIANLREPIRLGNIDKLQKASNSCEVKFQFMYQGRLHDFKSVGWGRNWMGIDLFLAVEMAKTLPIFKCLSMDDKATLLAHVGLANTVLSRAFYSVSQQSSVMIFPGGSMPMLPMLETGLEPEVFCRVLEPLLRVCVSVEEYVLLKAIMYCNANVPGLSDSGREILEEERARYATLLMRHIQRKHGSVKGATKFGEMLSLVDTYFHFGHRYWSHIALIEIALNMDSNRYGLISDVMRCHR